MTDSPNSSDLPRHAKGQPGAEIEVEPRQDGGVDVHFSDGSESLEISRREFMRIGGVAAASAAMTSVSCRNPVERVVPYVDRPQEVRIGKENTYTSVCSGCSTGCGVLVKTQGGRPIKLEGNPNHPVNKGKLCARGQSSYMQLYDPDRAEQPKANNTAGAEDTTWKKLDEQVVSDLKNADQVAVLTRSIDGPSRERLLAEATSSPKVTHYEYEPLNSEAVAEASRVSYGEHHIPHYQFQNADLIVSLGSDFLGTWLSPVEFTGQFSANRDPDESMNRLVAFEGHLSLTGSNADERHRVKYTDLVYVALGLANYIVRDKGVGPVSNEADILSMLEPYSLQAVADKTGLEESTLTDLGDELVEHTQNSLVVSGSDGSATENGVSLELAVNLLNRALGNIGHTLDRARPSSQRGGSFAELKQLEREAKAGNVGVLIIDRANPAYSAPNQFDFDAVRSNVSTIVYAGDRVNETASRADYVATASHQFEKWGDSNPVGGVYAVRQPTIRPLYNTRTFEESLLGWFSESDIVPDWSSFVEAEDESEDSPGLWYRYVRDTWKKQIYSEANVPVDFDSFWEDVLREGAYETPKDGRGQPGFDAKATAAKISESLPGQLESSEDDDATGLGDKELHLFPTVPLFDGRDANNGHLQELPDPISKHAWGSYALVSPATFKEADLELGDVVEIEVERSGKAVSRQFPVIMQPGLHDDVVAVPLGYGRQESGIVADDLGQNGFALAGTHGDRLMLSGLSANVSKTGDNEDVAIMQGSQLIDIEQRDLLATATIDEYEKDPEAGIPTHPPGKDLWEDHDYGDLKWGMSIDLSKCTGCNACVTACQEENNIPVVGKQGVMEGREMHWMRIDRYYKMSEAAKEKTEGLVSNPMFEDDPYVGLADHLENPRVIMQPMLCQHCESAPCETVCPVAATTHSSDGINQMAYNRCVGTRYCANNCPYKVRRFNWYSYSTDRRNDSILNALFPEMDTHGDYNVEEPLPMGLNPDVTVRSRGVMEKCTFCIQRIRKASSRMKQEGRSQFQEGDVVTACQQSCPAGAIEFGNLLDPDAKVAQKHAHDRTLSPLSHLNVKSSIGYMTSVWNTEKQEET